MTTPTAPGASPAAAAGSKNRRPLLLILFMFAAPLAFAFWLYYGSSWRPLQRTNHGELIEPVVPLPPLALPLAGAPDRPGGAASQVEATPRMAPATLLIGKWSLVVVGLGAGAGESGCDADCRNSLLYARQTWLSLGKLLPRVQRVLLAGDGCCDLAYLQREHHGLRAVQAAGGGAAPLLRLIPQPYDHTIFVVDPLGNLMMRYDARLDPKGLREDLKKLLELSHIG